MKDTVTAMAMIQGISLRNDDEQRSSAGFAKKKEKRVATSESATCYTGSRVYSVRTIKLARVSTIHALSVYYVTNA